MYIFEALTKALRSLYCISMYKACFVAFALLGTAVFGGVVELGAPLPSHARKIAKHRFSLSQDFKMVMRFYKATLPVARYPRKQIIHQPGIKAIHIVNSSARGAWAGMNVYEVNGEVRIYVIPRPQD